MNEEIYEGTPSQEDVLIGTDSGYNRYRRPDGSTYVHYPYSRMATVTAYSAKDGKGQSIRTADGKLITGNTQAEADRKRFRYDLNHWVEANRRNTAHLPQDWRNKYTLSEGKDALTMIPVAGDVLDLGNVYTDFNKGDYGMAAAGLGLMFVPNIVEKPLKWVGKPIIKRIKNRKAAKAFSEAVDESVIPEYKLNPYSDKPANYVLSVPLTEDVGKTSLRFFERSPLNINPKGSWTHPFKNNMGLLDHRTSSVTGNNFGDFIAEGSEQMVFNNPNNINEVLKIYSDVGQSSLNDLRKFVKLYQTRNNVPFLLPTTFVGHVSDKNGLLYPVFSQQKILKTLLNDLLDWNTNILPRLNTLMKSVGFNGSGYYRRGTQEIGDIHPLNMIELPNGLFRFIDAFPQGFRKGGKLIKKLYANT